MLCSKEPPPSRPTPQPSEGCFQFETDYAGNVGNDMGVPTAGYRAGRFNLPEWQEATYAKYYQSFADRDNAERLRNVSTDMIKETTALARLTQVTTYTHHGEVDLVRLKPILRTTTSFSALTLLVGSFHP